MNCEELEPWVSAYQDGELDSRRRRIVEAHLAGCADCRSLADGWAALAQDIRTSLWRLDAPESLHTRVMRRIPAPVSRASVRYRPRWPQGWPSFALVPIGAVAAWLFWAARPALKAPLTPQNPATAPAVEAFGAPMQGGTVQALFPGNSPGSQIDAMLGLRSRTGERTKANGHPKVIRAPVHGARPGKSEGRRPAEEDALRRLRRLRPRRARYVLVRYRPGDGLRRHRPWSRLAARPEQPPVEETAQSPVALPRIHVVEYVLPAVQPPAPAADAASEYVLRPAQPAQVIEAGFDL